MALRVREAAFLATDLTLRSTCAVFRRAIDFVRDMALLAPVFARAVADLRRRLRFGFAPSPIIPLSLSTVSPIADLAFAVMVCAFKADLRK